MKTAVLALLCWMFLSGVVHAQSCTPNNNNSFTINGNTLSNINPLVAGNYTVCISVQMNGASNSGQAFPVVITAQTSSGCSTDGTSTTDQRAVYTSTSNFSGTVYWNDCYQVIDGWSSDVECCGYASNPGAGDNPVSVQGANALYTDTGTNLGLTLHRQGCDTAFENGSVNCVTIPSAWCTTLQRLAANGAVWWASTIGAPQSLMTTTGGGFYQFATTPSNMQAYADFLTTWLVNTKAACGISPAYFSVENEPSGNGGGYMTPTGTYGGWPLFFDQFITNYLGPDLAAHGFGNVGLIIPDDPGLNISGTGPDSTCMNDSACAKYIKVIAYHCYGGIPGAGNPWPGRGLRLWMTECAVDNSGGVGAGISSNIDITGFIDIGSNVPWSEENTWGSNSVTGCCAGEYYYDDTGPLTLYWYEYPFSHYIRPGWHIYGATPQVGTDSSNDPVNLVFARSPTTKDFVIIASNSMCGSCPTQTLNVTFNGFTANTITPVLTAGDASIYAQTQASITAGNGFSYLMPYNRSVIAFIGTAN